ncbi:type II secretion system major pseudopilin GspG [Methylobacterium frigidaeris]|uniref:Type II secretion system core protein G n=1 Tax=Methylobacterium frigidaeris TaxID=2038277 RepID=A0AA37H7R4_9HYPH|nr:type II secretion system major pseudopilin GspG [Methylobacterium frigidaeris]PIK68881.1 type II secretion system protein GspG [Methylobacterium frigidaeris]GJD60628.1 Type II secretion system protein G [Methylobacterium frigidaeris]
MFITTQPDRGEPRETRSEDRRDSQAGFSLVELLVVLAIIGMIATMVTPQVLGYLGRAKGETARIQVKNIAQAVELYYLDLGAYPTSQQGLQALVQPTGPGWRGPYVRDARGLTDPWGHAYLYRSPGAAGTPFEVYSLGADGKAGGGGDQADVASN